MHKFNILAIAAIMCMRMLGVVTIKHTAAAAATTTTTTTTAKPTIADAAITIVQESMENVFVFVGKSFLNFIRDREDGNRAPQFDLITQLPKSFFNFIVGREGDSGGSSSSSSSTNAASDAGIGHMFVQQLIAIMDADIPAAGGDSAAPTPLTYANVDVLQFVCNSFFHYITNTEGANHAKNKNIMEKVMYMLF